MATIKQMAVWIERENNEASARERSNRSYLDGYRQDAAEKQVPQIENGEATCLSLRGPSSRLADFRNDSLRSSRRRQCHR